VLYIIAARVFSGAETAGGCSYRFPIVVLTVDHQWKRLVGQLSAPDSVLDYIKTWYHVPVLLALAAFMFWIRVRNWRNFLISGRVYFSGNDPWYHLRQVRYIVRHWPWTMPFDPWTSYPTGTSVGQFGTLYDQLVATAALIVGLGSPTEQTTALVLLFAPAVIGTLAVIPTYLLGRRFGGRFGGIVGVAILALSPGSFLFRSVVGFSDHHAAEVLFQALAVAAIVIALAVAEREKPVYEQFVEREFTNLRRPVGWAALAGVAITLYIWTWPPGLLLVGIFGVFLLIALPLQYLRGRSPEHIAVVGAVALSVAGVLMLVTFKTTEISVTNFSVLHPALAFAGALGCVFMAWLARTMEAHDLPALAYPGTIAGLFVAGVVVFAVALPTVFDFFLNQLNRIVGFGTNAAALTVGEIQPPFPTRPGTSFSEAVDATLEFFHNAFGLAYPTAAAGALIMLGRLALGRTEQWAASVFVLVWTAFITSATLTQARFSYYLLIPVAVMNAYLVGRLLHFVGDSGVRSSFSDLEAYQVLSVVFVVFLITAPLAFLSGAGPLTALLGGGPLTAASASANVYTSGPNSGVLGWDDSLQWLQNNTPKESTYNGNPANSFGYYEKFTPPDDNFNYPNGAYGVLSWWDYGHWITTLGHRAPIANPFQQNVRKVANFLLATNASAANEIARMPDGEGARYVMISWEMADPTGILGAPFAWETKWSVSYPSDALTPIYVRQSDCSVARSFWAHEQRYYEAMRTRLYGFHGSAIEPKPVVLNYENPIAASGDSLGAAFYPTGNESVVKRFANMSAARQFVEEEGSARIGGVGRYPQERVPALEHYRLVHASNRSALGGQFARTALQRLRATGLNTTGLFATPMNWVKTFERVPGARVVGYGPPNATVEATVEMRMPHSNATFNYTQQATTNAQGRFTMTLPYSTTGYRKWGTQRGATNVSVRATGPYTFHTVEGPGEKATWTATAEVPEGIVIGRVDGPIRVTMQRKPGDPLTGDGSDANATSVNATNVSDGSATTTNASAVTNGPVSNASSANTMAASETNHRVGRAASALIHGESNE
jgi:oligosaccharyl transferase (archaeosortase A-associated)